MKLLLLFAFLALLCMARTAPASSTTAGRKLVFQEYNDEDEETDKSAVEEVDAEEAREEDDDDNDDEEEEEQETTTTTTTTTTRAPFQFPTRNRNTVPSRRPFINQRTSTTTTTERTTTLDFDDDSQEETENRYDGDFKYVKDFRKYFQKLMEDIRKLIRNITGGEFFNNSQNSMYNQPEDE